MIVSDIQGRVKRQFGDEAQVQITDLDIINWINDAQRHIVVNNDALLQKTALADVIADQQEYNFPADCLIFRSLNIKHPNGSYLPLKSFSLQEFDTQIYGWDSSPHKVALPSIFHTYEDKFRVYPLPAAAITNGWKIYYSRYPTDVATNDSQLGLPLSYHSTILAFCLQQAYEQDEDWKASEVKEKQVQRDIILNKGREQASPHEFYPTMTVLPEDM